jgi:hypothetical protein
MVKKNLKAARHCLLFQRQQGQQMTTFFFWMNCMVVQSCQGCLLFICKAMNCVEPQNFAAVLVEMLRATSLRFPKYSMPSNVVQSLAATGFGDNETYNLSMQL